MAEKNGIIAFTCSNINCQSILWLSHFDAKRETRVFAPQAILGKTESALHRKQEAEVVGFLYYHILCRMMDLDEDGLIQMSCKLLFIE